MEIQITSCFSFCYEKNTEMRNIKNTGHFIYYLCMCTYIMVY